MKNRELTYYSLSPPKDLLHKFRVADTSDSEGFINMGFDEKWRWDLWIVHNNEAFLGLIGNQVDLKELNKILDKQLILYAKKHSDEYEARKDWLEHTIFICKNEYHNTKNEVFKEALNWCKKWLKKEVIQYKEQNTLLKNNESQKEENNLFDENNDFIKSTIEDHLELIKNYFNQYDYDLLLSELVSYFKTDAFTNSNQIIKIINRPNKKLIASTLNNIYYDCFNDNRKLSVEYLKFGAKRISIFGKDDFDENQYLKSNLYKYYKSNGK
jgi:hypothetical protein